MPKAKAPQAPDKQVEQIPREETRLSPDDIAVVMAREDAKEAVRAKYRERIIENALVAARVRAFLSRMELLGINPRVQVRGDVMVIPRVVPSEVRELARETLLAVGIPVLIDSALFGTFHSERIAAVNALRHMGMPSAFSLMDGMGNEGVPGVVLMPALDPEPLPPGEQIGVVEAPKLTQRTAAIERARKALGNGNGAHV